MSAQEVIKWHCRRSNWTEGMSSWVSVKEFLFSLIREICRRRDCPIEDESGLILRNKDQRVGLLAYNSL